MMIHHEYYTFISFFTMFFPYIFVHQRWIQPCFTVGFGLPRKELLEADGTVASPVESPVDWVKVTGKDDAPWVEIVEGGALRFGPQIGVGGVFWLWNPQIFFWLKWSSEKSDVKMTCWLGLMTFLDVFYFFVVKIVFDFWQKTCELWSYGVVDGFRQPRVGQVGSSIERLGCR